MKRKNRISPIPATICTLAAFLCAFLFIGTNFAFAASTASISTTTAQPSATANTENQIKKLQSSLRITADQSKLWNDLTAVMRENAKEMDAQTMALNDETRPQDAVEHLKYNYEVSEMYLEQQNRIIPPFEALYDSLSDQQKDIIDRIFMTGK